MDARVGMIWIYRSSRQNDNISSTSYQSVNRTARVSVKVSSPNRDIFFQWSEEVIRCLMAVRRSGHQGLGGYNYLEVNSDNEVQNEFGFWSGTIEVKLVRYCKPIDSSGMARSPFNREHPNNKNVNTDNNSNTAQSGNGD